MPKASRVAESTTSTSSASITLSGAVLGRRTLASKHTVGETGIELVVEDAAGNWLEGVYTYTSANPTVMTRTAILSSSNNDADVTFPDGAKLVQETASGNFLTGLGNSVPSDISFSTTVPLTNTAGAYMPTQTVAGPLAFTPASGAVRGAFTVLPLIADGTNMPTFSGFTEHGSSTGYDNRAQYLNIVQFFNVAGSNWWANSQAATPAVIPSPASGLSLSGPSSGVVNVASSNYMVALTPNGATSNGVVVTPTPVSGVTFSPSSFTLTTGSPSATFTANSSTTGAKSIAITNNAGLTNPSPITYTVAAAATAPAQMSAPVATAGVQSASITMTAPSNGGSAITGYTVTSNPAGGVDSSAGTTALTRNITGLTAGTAYVFTSTATNGVGTSPASPSSNSITPTAPAAFARMAQLSNVTESGSGPYTYTSIGGSGTTANYAAGVPGPGGVLTTVLQSSVDGSFACTLSRIGTYSEPIIGVDPSSTLKSFNALAYGLYGHSAPTYQAITGGTIANGNGSSLAPNAGDILRIRRVGTSLIAEVARAASPTTFTIIQTWTGVSTGVLYIQPMISGGSGDTPAALSNFTTSGLA